MAPMPTNPKNVRKNKPTSKNITKARASRQAPTVVGIWLFDRIQGRKGSLPPKDTATLIVEEDFSVEERTFLPTGAVHVERGHAKIDRTKLTVRWERKQRSARVYTVAADSLLWVDTAEELDRPQTEVGRRIDRKTLDRHESSVQRVEKTRAKAALGVALKDALGRSGEAPPWVARGNERDLDGPPLFVADGQRFEVRGKVARPGDDRWTIELRSKNNVDGGRPWVGVTLKIPVTRPNAGDVFMCAPDIPAKKALSFHAFVPSSGAAGTSGTQGIGGDYRPGGGAVDEQVGILRFEEVALAMPKEAHRPGGTLRVSVFVHVRRTGNVTHALAMRAVVDVPVHVALVPAWARDA